MLIFATLLFALVGCDQATKGVATRYLDPRAPISYLGDTFVLQYAQNQGAFLSLGGRLSPTWRFWLLTVANGVVLAGLAVYLLKCWNMPIGWFVCWTLILGGGIGNLIDRSTQQGLVTDFLNVGIGPLRTGIFNVADMAVTAGVCTLFALWWREDRAKARQATSAAITQRAAQAAEAPPLCKGGPGGIE
jgi:signal peptidase II